MLKWKKHGNFQKHYFEIFSNREILPIGVPLVQSSVAVDPGAWAVVNAPSL